MICDHCKFGDHCNGHCTCGCRIDTPGTVKRFWVMRGWDSAILPWVVRVASFDPQTGLQRSLWVTLHRHGWGKEALDCVADLVDAEVERLTNAT